MRILPLCTIPLVNLVTIFRSLLQSNSLPFRSLLQSNTCLNLLLFTILTYMYNSSSQRQVYIYPVAIMLFSLSLTFVLYFYSYSLILSLPSSFFLFLYVPLLYFIYLSLLLPSLSLPPSLLYPPSIYPSIPQYPSSSLSSSLRLQEIKTMRLEILALEQIIAIMGEGMKEHEKNHDLVAPQSKQT